MVNPDEAPLVGMPTASVGMVNGEFPLYLFAACGLKPAAVIFEVK
jgi:hypothetical protein